MVARKPRLAMSRWQARCAQARRVLAHREQRLSLCQYFSFCARVRASSLGLALSLPRSLSSSLSHCSLSISLSVSLSSLSPLSLHSTLSLSLLLSLSFSLAFSLSRSLCLSHADACPTVAAPTRLLVASTGRSCLPELKFYKLRPIQITTVTSCCLLF